MVDPLCDALDRFRILDDKHYPITRNRHPGEVCSFDSMTWPCDTQKALDAAEPFLSAALAVSVARVSETDA